MDRGAHEINAWVRDCERRQVLMVAALPSQRSHNESNRSQQLRQHLAHALHELAARVAPSVGFSRISASSEQSAATK